MIVGGGPDEEKYKELVAEHALDERVIFIGQVDRSEVTKYRRMLDVFLMPSRSEGLGNAGLSALASRIPLVATQVGGLAEYVYDPEHNPDKEPNAWVVEPDSPDQIAAAVERILNEPEEVQRRSKNGHRMVVRHYQWDNIATDMREKVFTRLFEAGNHD
jgi:glycosyltransferase involved in cell wall biosynthesis